MNCFRCALGALAFLLISLISCGRDQDSGTRVGTETQIAFIDSAGESVYASYALRSQSFGEWPWADFPQPLYSGASSSLVLAAQDSLFLESYNADSSAAAWGLVGLQAGSMAVRLSSTDSLRIGLAFASDTILAAWYGFLGTGVHGPVAIGTADTLAFAHVPKGTHPFVLFLEGVYARHRLDFQVSCPGSQQTVANLPVDQLIGIAGDSGCEFQIDEQGVLVSDENNLPMCN